MSLVLLFYYLLLNIHFRSLRLIVDLFHVLYCSVRIEALALASLFSGECLVDTCVVVLETVYLQVLAAAVSYVY